MTGFATKTMLAAALIGGATLAYAKDMMMPDHPISHDAVARLWGADGKPVGTASLHEGKGGLKLTVKVNGLTPGEHGIHIHTIGKCEAPGFTTAGGHWNPTMHQHGKLNPMGPHQGDLPNLVVGADGRGTLTVTIAGATLEGLMDADGGAIVIHEKADDLKTDPSGNSGARIACGIVMAKLGA